MDFEWQPTSDGRGLYCFPPDSSNRLVVKERRNEAVWWGLYQSSDSGEDDLDLIEEGIESDIEAAMEASEMAFDLL